MKIIAMAAAIALLTGLSAAGFAQADKPATAAAAGDTKPEAKSEAPMLKMTARKGGIDADARECLKFPTNREIHICAEKYRP